MVSLIRKKGRKGTGNKTFNTPPLVQAYVRVAKAKKQIQRLQASMSHMIHKEIMVGMGSNDAIFTSSTPCFFAGNATMTQCIEQKKIEKKIVPFNGKFKSLRYSFRSGIVQNELNIDTDLYEPDLIGRKAHPESVTIENPNDYVSSDGNMSYDMKNIMSADIENKHTHRFLSLICNKTELLKESIQHYINGIKLPSISTSEQNVTLDHHVRIISSIKDKTSEMRHYCKSHEKIKTADYIVQIINTEHQFTCKNDTYGWKIYKKNVFATLLNSKNKNVNIPVCEELILQYQHAEKSNKKNHPILINGNSCLVIACSIISSENLPRGSNISPFASFHFFGDNALSISMGADNNQYMIQDRTRLCARLTGKLCKAFLGIHSSKKTDYIKSIMFFRELFMRSDAGDLKKYLQGRATDDEIEEFKRDNLIALGTEFRDILPSYEQTLQSPERISNMRQKIRKINSGKADGFLEEFLVFKSFVIRQNIRSLINANNGKICNSRKCVSSQSFSVLALTPQPGKNYVFITTHFHDTKHHENKAFTTGPVKFFSDMEEKIPYSNPDTRRVSLPTWMKRDSSDAAFDLEYELSML